MSKRRRYLSYMLRLWETSNGERRIWRASLESPGSGQRRGFGSLRCLVEFLEAETGYRIEEHDEPEAERGEERGEAADS